MTATVVAKEDSTKKGFKSALRALSPGRTREPQAEGDKSGVVSSGNKDKGDKDKGDKSAPSNKTWMGTEKKKPRAEYQAEIDELSAKVQALEAAKADGDRQVAQQVARVSKLTQELNSFKMWVRQAPRV